MPAYVITEVSIHDQREFEEYRKLVPATVTAFNGKFIARGGEVTTLEGNWNPERIVIIEFPTTKNAKDWWSSDSYSRAKVIREKAAKTKMIIIDGV